ncbi:MAG: hypothetical protein HC900_12590 [Methylacidiphilales bacterium]|nr:hypothetical protein [Candidatus Methylacidiphilales bacterium]
MCLAVVAGALALPAVPAQAQVVALVNGDPITALDVTHRTRLLTLINQGRAPDRKAVLEELVDERLKLREARKFGATPSDSEVESAFANVASRARLSSSQFAQMLSAQGSNERSFKDRLRADIAWNGLVRARFKVVAQVGDHDVAEVLSARKQASSQRVTEYTLRNVVFVVPRAPAMPPMRRAAARPRRFAPASRAARRDSPSPAASGRWWCATRSGRPPPT